MPSADSLPGDQRAVLTLVLGRGRSYEEIARLLTIEPDAVSGRASAALDALGPATDVAAADRELIGDYLLGQLPADELSDLQDLLAGSPPARAWARAVRAALDPLAAGPLPVVSSQPGDRPPAKPEEPVPPAPPRRRAAAGTERPAPAREAEPARAPVTAAPRASAAPPVATGAPPAPRASDDEPPRSSRAGGAALILVALIVAAALVVILTRHHHHASSTADRSVAGSSVTQTSTSASSSASATPVAQINLDPTSSTSKATAIADILRDGSGLEVALIGEDLPANSAHDSYEVWLYNSESDAHSLGFVSPGVTANGRLSSAAPLPTNAARYKKIIITTETARTPTHPGPILLSGTLSGL